MRVAGTIFVILTTARQILYLTLATRRIRPIFHTFLFYQSVFHLSPIKGFGSWWFGLFCRFQIHLPGDCRSRSKKIAGRTNPATEPANRRHAFQAPYFSHYLVGTFPQIPDHCRDNRPALATTTGWGPRGLREAGHRPQTILLCRRIPLHFTKSATV